jgi:hypothetical protein
MARKSSSASADLPERPWWRCLSPFGVFTQKAKPNIYRAIFRRINGIIMCTAIINREEEDATDTSRYSSTFLRPREPFGAGKSALLF